MSREFNVSKACFFVSPDDSYREISSLIKSSNKSILIATYSFTNPSLGEDLLDAKRREVNVTVMVEGSPVGGLKEDVISYISKNVSVFLNENDDYDYHHAKYAVFDGKITLVSTENFGVEGMSPDPTYGNRGWFALIYDENVSRFFSSVFYDDLDKSSKYFKDRRFTSAKVNHGRYVPRFGMKCCRDANVIVFFGPNVTENVLNFIKSSKGKIWIEQFYIYKNWDHGSNPLLEKVINESESKDVKVLLDSSWYNMKKDKPNSNYNTLIYLKKNNISAKVLDKKSTGLLKLHTKGGVTRDSVLISSVNWNEHSIMKNREVGVIVRCNGAPEFFSDVFTHDYYTNSQTGGSIPKFVVLVLSFGGIAFLLYAGIKLR